MSEPQSIESLTDKVITLNDGESPMSIRQAANALAQHRYKEDAAEERAAAAPPEAAAPAQDAAEEAASAAPPQEATGEEATATIDQPETAPLDLPRSWAKD